MSTSAEAGSSRTQSAKSGEESRRIARMGKKTGGTGKKGKKFMDDKTSILDLVENVTSAKEASVRAKLSKFDRGGRREGEVQNEDQTTQEDKKPIEKDSSTGGKERKKSRAVQRKLEIDRAKLALIEKAKEKKKRKKAPLAETKPQRRKVAFST